MTLEWKFEILPELCVFCFCFFVSLFCFKLLLNCYVSLCPRTVGTENVYRCVWFRCKKNKLVVINPAFPEDQICDSSWLVNEVKWGNVFSWWEAKVWDLFPAQTADSLFVIRELYPSFRSFSCIVAIPRGKAADAELMCGVQVAWTDWDDRAMFVTGKQGERERWWGSRSEMKWLIVSFLSSLCSQGPLSSIRAVIKRSEYSLSQMNTEPRKNETKCAQCLEWSWYFLYLRFTVPKSANFPSANFFEGVNSKNKS